MCLLSHVTHEIDAYFKTVVASAMAVEEGRGAGQTSLLWLESTLQHRTKYYIYVVGDKTVTKNVMIE